MTLATASAGATPGSPATGEFSGSDIGALAHLYRAEVYRSTMWRGRLDNTTNWAVASLGLSISATFSAKEASAFPVLMAGLFILAFLTLEARRYRYFNIWRTRARWLEYYFYSPMLRGEPIVPNGKWARDLSGDYNTPAHRISLATAFNRRLKRNYMWIFAIQLIAYFGKLSLHPSAAGSFATIVERAAIGPIPGNVVLAIGGIYYAGLSAFAIFWPMIDSGERSQRSDALKALVDELGPDMN